MNKKFFMLSVALIMTITFCSLAHAGLINYKRRGTGGAAPTGGGYNRPAPQAAAPATGPSWKRQSPRAETADEKKYDINRDGLLQTAEIKIYLRDVIDGIAQKGGYTVDSNILKEYDKNKDGVISAYELPEIRNDVAN